MTEMKLYLAQRVSAAIILPLVLGHLAVMIWAIRGGLTAAEIVGRLHGSAFWFGYYALFVVAVAIHGAIGLRTIASEWFGLRGAGATGLAVAFLVAALSLGQNAVVALVFGS